MLFVSKSWLFVTTLHQHEPSFISMASMFSHSPGTARISIPLRMFGISWIRNCQILSDKICRHAPNNLTGMVEHSKIIFQKSYPYHAKTRLWGAFRDTYWKHVIRIVKHSVLYCLYNEEKLLIYMLKHVAFLMINSYIQYYIHHYIVV
jgi:hypothetical protein